MADQSDGRHDSKVDRNSFEWIPRVLIQPSDTVVLDLTAAVTLFGLDLLEHVRHYHPKVSVPQSVIDAISKKIDEHKIMGSGRPIACDV